jgi:hypothetical protein
MPDHRLMVTVVLRDERIRFCQFDANVTQFQHSLLLDSLQFEKVVRRHDGVAKAVGHDECYILDRLI